VNVIVNLNMHKSQSIGGFLNLLLKSVKDLIPINRCEGGFLCLLLKSGRDLMPIYRCEGGFLCLLLKSGRDLMPIYRYEGGFLCLLLKSGRDLMPIYYQMVKPLPIMLGKVPCEQPITATLAIHPT